MKPIAIFRHYPTEGPGYFATVLERQGLRWELLRIDAGDPVPAAAKVFAGLVFMGGPMSVNDELPWIPQILALIRDAVQKDVPVLGHCLGAQLMAKALGGAVTRNPVKEIGWGRVDVVDDDGARNWFGDTRSFLSFHWHGETFSLPKNASRIAASPYCANQAFVLGKHLGLQCHVEMTPEMISAWCQSGEKEIRYAKSPAVRHADEIQAQLPARVAALHRVADRLYERWIEGLDRGD